VARSFVPACRAHSRYSARRRRGRVRSGRDATRQDWAGLRRRRPPPRAREVRTTTGSKQHVPPTGRRRPLADAARAPLLISLAPAGPGPGLGPGQTDAAAGDFYRETHGETRASINARARARGESAWRTRSRARSRAAAVRACVSDPSGRAGRTAAASRTPGASARRRRAARRRGDWGRAGDGPTRMWMMTRRGRGGAGLRAARRSPVPFRDRDAREIAGPAAATRSWRGGAGESDPSTDGDLKPGWEGGACDEGRWIVRSRTRVYVQYVLKYYAAETDGQQPPGPRVRTARQLSPWQLVGPACQGNARGRSRSDGAQARQEVRCLGILEVLVDSFLSAWRRTAGQTVPSTVVFPRLFLSAATNATGASQSTLRLSG
jgi:hypothetical protein